MVDGIQDFIESIQNNYAEPSKTYRAEVSSIDNEGTVWVYLAGSNIETPTAVSSSEVNVGDVVTVEWRNNKLYIAGNVSNPSAGIVRMTTVEQVAQVANSLALEASASAETARTAAESAVYDAGVAHDAAISAQDSLKNVVRGASTVEKAVSVMQTALEAVVEYNPATDTTQEYFWHDANGAHVLGDTSGYRNDIDSTGMRIIDTNTEKSVAEFGSAGARIGDGDRSYISITDECTEFHGDGGELVGKISYGGSEESEYTQDLTPSATAYTDYVIYNGSIAYEPIGNVVISGDLNGNNVSVTFDGASDYSGTTSDLNVVYDAASQALTLSSSVKGTARYRCDSYWIAPDHRSSGSEETIQQNQTGIYTFNDSLVAGTQIIAKSGLEDGNITLTAGTSETKTVSLYSSILARNLRVTVTYNATENTVSFKPLDSTFILDTLEYTYYTVGYQSFTATYDREFKAPNYVFGDGTTNNLPYVVALGRGLLAYEQGQLLTGKYNLSTEGAVVVGNGVESARNNALVVTWDGDISLAIDNNASAGTVDGDLYNALVAIGWR